MDVKDENLKIIGMPPNDVSIVDANDGELVVWISSDFWEMVGGDEQQQDLVFNEKSD